MASFFEPKPIKTTPNRISRAALDTCKTCQKIAALLLCTFQCFPRSSSSSICTIETPIDCIAVRASKSQNILSDHHVFYLRLRGEIKHREEIGPLRASCERLFFFESLHCFVTLLTFGCSFTMGVPTQLQRNFKLC